MSATTFSSYGQSATLPFGVPGVLAHWFRQSQQRARDRAALAQMSDRDLLDMRTNRYEVSHALAKPFWRD